MPPVKETSDSLSHPVVETPHIAVAPSRRTAADYLALAVATCGVGFIPVAPGTWGSAVGLVIFVLFNSASNALLVRDPTLLGGQTDAPVLAALANGLVRATFVRTSALLILVIAVVLLGIWAANRVESLTRRKDPGVVVIDEVAGQLITFLFVPWDSQWWVLVVGFLAFRVFDIWKPYPINRLEALESGLGVMADDVLAGAYAATLLSLLTSIYLLS